MSKQKPSYDAGRIEAARQAVWERRGDYEAPQPAPGQARVYVKPSSPFTSGNLHMGHVRDYSIGDAYARFRRARGDAVLLGFGFDAFGLPAELAAIERQEPPAEWVAQCGERMLGQMKRLGFSFDYDRVFYSSDEGQYRWSQWLFLKLLENDLIYREDATVDWCDTCQTTLASIQVEDGRCWRCHNEVRLIRRPTWFLRITPYLDENDRNTEKLENWDELALSTQRYILGRSDGVELDLEGDGGPLTVFSPHRGAVGLASFVLLSPRHPEIDAWVTDAAVQEELDQMRSGGWDRSARDARSVPVFDTGAAVVGPGGDDLPVLVSPLVDARFGPTAAFGIPAVDDADRDIAGRIARVPAPAEPAEDGGRVTARPPARPPRWPAPARPSATGPTTSRSRASAPGARRSRSSTARSAVPCRCPRPICRWCCRATSSRPAKGTRWPSGRTSSTSSAPPAAARPSARPTPSTATSTRSGSGCPAAVPPADRAEQMFEHPDLQEWLPSERLVAGGDSGGFVFDQRIVTKALRDIGPFAFMADGEPFAGCLFHEMVIADGRKMSKHLGNVVNPDELVEQYGADTVRLAILYAAGPAKTLNWSDGSLRFANRFLRGLWTYSHDRFAALEDSPARRGGGGRDRVHARPPAQMVRERAGPHHRGHRAAADAQGGPQHHPPLRADPGLREAGGRAPRSARPGRCRGADRGPGVAGASAGAVRAAHRRGAAARLGPARGGRSARSLARFGVDPGLRRGPGADRLGDLGQKVRPLSKLA